MHARRQDIAGIDVLDLVLDATDRRRALLTAVHQHDALNDIVVIVLTGDALARQVRHLDLGDIRDLDWDAFGRGDDDVSYIVRRLDQTDAADDRRLGSEVQGLAADIDIGIANRRDHLRHRNAIASHPVTIKRDLVAFRFAAPAGHVDDARHGLKAALQHPVLKGLQVGQAIARRPHDAIAHDLADRAGRRHRRLRPAIQRPELAQAVDDTLLRLVVGEVVSELDLDVRQTEQGNGAHACDVGDARHLDLDRDRDVAFDLFRRQAGRLGHHLYHRRHRIGISFDVQLRKRITPYRQHGDQEQGDKPTLMDGETDKLPHYEFRLLELHGSGRAGLVDKERTANDNLLAAGQAAGNFRVAGAD